MEKTVVPNQSQNNSPAEKEENLNQCIYMFETEIVSLKFLAI